jgi:hypothetical protein
MTRIWKQEVATSSKYKLGFYLEGLSKLKENLIEDSGCPGRDSLGVSKLCSRRVGPERVEGNSFEVCCNKRKSITCIMNVITRHLRATDAAACSC